MRWRYIAYLVGILAVFLSLSMILPLLCSFYYKDQSALPIIKSIVITLVSGSILYLFFHKSSIETISQREGMAIVATGWTAVGFFGALVAGIIRKEQVVIPSGNSMIEPDDRVIIVAKRKAVQKVESMLTVKLEFF